MNNWLFWAVLMAALMGCSSGGRDHADAGGCEGSECAGGDPPPTSGGGNQCRDGQVWLQGRCQQPPAQPQPCPTGQVQSGGVCRPVQGLAVELLDHQACVTDNGATQLVVRFVNRDSNGRALGDATGIASELRVDGRPLDRESLIDSQSELLQSDLFMSLVLDASYSMMLQDPPAFEPMLTAAEELTTTASATWRANGSDFQWGLAWFNELVYQPAPPPDWAIADIGRIPPPEEGTFTSLYKAVSQMSALHWQRYQAGVASDARDQHIMIVLSDGADNYSWLDNSDKTITHNLDSNLRYVARGGQTTELVDLATALARQPNLRVYVIGIGSDVNQRELETIANYGKGAYFHDEDTGAVGNLFERVSEQFVTVQTLGALTPLRPATYEISIRSSLAGGEAVASEPFTLDTGDLPDCAR